MRAVQPEPREAVETLVVSCECGFEVRGTADEVVSVIAQHALDNHNMKATREQVLARARPA